MGEFVSKQALYMMNASHYGLQVFRYRATDGYYDEGDVLGSYNYWKIADQIRGYSGFAFWSFASAMNLYVSLVEASAPHYLRVLRLRRVFNVVAYLLDMVAYDKAWIISEDEGETTADRASAAIVMAAVKSDMIWESAMMTATNVALYSMEGDDWMGDSSDDEGEDSGEDSGKDLSDDEI